MFNNGQSRANGPVFKPLRSRTTTPRLIFPILQNICMPSNHMQLVDSQVAIANRTHLAYLSRKEFSFFGGFKYEVKHRETTAIFKKSKY